MCRRYHAMITHHATLSFFVSNDECTQPTTPLERPFKKVSAFYDIGIEITLHRYSKTLSGQVLIEVIKEAVMSTLFFYF